MKATDVKVSIRGHASTAEAGTVVSSADTLHWFCLRCRKLVNIFIQGWRVRCVECGNTVEPAKGR